MDVHNILSELIPANKITQTGFLTSYHCYNVLNCVQFQFQILTSDRLTQEAKQPGKSRVFTVIKNTIEFYRNPMLFENLTHGVQLRSELDYDTPSSH